MTRNDQLLNRLENSIQRLKLDYDIFFNGGGNLPQKSHDSLDLEIKNLFNALGLTYAQRFRLNSLATRFSVYNGLWQRNLRMVEQGLNPLQQGSALRPKPRERFEVRIAAETDQEAIELLLEAFCRAREISGNEAPIDPLKFEQFIARKLREAKEKKGCAEVVFIVSTEDGEVHLKTRASS